MAVEISRPFPTCNGMSRVVAIPSPPYADDVIAYHLRQAFKPGEVTPEEANQIGRELALKLTKGNHAFVVCTHVDKHHVHNHIIINSTTLDWKPAFGERCGAALPFGCRRSVL